MSAAISAGDLARLVDGHLIGDPAVQLAGVASLDRARPGELSFVAGRRYLPALAASGAGAVLLARELAEAVPPGERTVIVVADAYAALRRALLAFAAPPSGPSWGIDRSASIGLRVRWEGRLLAGSGARIGDDTRLGRDCRVEAHAIVAGGVVMGDECIVESGAWIGFGVSLGNRVRVGAGARVGTAGFGFVPDPAGHLRMPHPGGCVLEDDVEIGANTTVDRGSVGDTRIGQGTKIDNLVQIAHNVVVGRRCLIMAQAGLAGSTEVQDNVIIAGQAGLAGHLTVGAGARIGAQAGVIGDVPRGATYSGYPARNHRDVLRQTAVLARLADHHGKGSGA